jgi:hypothetical protein
MSTTAFTMRDFRQIPQANGKRILPGLDAWRSRRQPVVPRRRIHELRIVCDVARARRQRRRATGEKRPPMPIGVAGCRCIAENNAIVRGAVVGAASAYSEFILSAC